MGTGRFLSGGGTHPLARARVPTVVPAHSVVRVEVHPPRAPRVRRLGVLAAVVGAEDEEVGHARVLGAQLQIAPDLLVLARRRVVCGAQAERARDALHRLPVGNGASNVLQYFDAGAWKGLSACMWEAVSINNLLLGGPEDLSARAGRGILPKQSAAIRKPPRTGAHLSKESPTSRMSTSSSAGSERSEPVSRASRHSEPTSCHSSPSQ